MCSPILKNKFLLPCRHDDYSEYPILQTAAMLPITVLLYSIQWWPTCPGAAGGLNFTVTSRGSAGDTSAVQRGPMWPMHAWCLTRPQPHCIFLHTSQLGSSGSCSNMYILLDPTSESNRVKEEGGALHEVMIKLANTTTLR